MTGAVFRRHKPESNECRNRKLHDNQRRKETGVDFTQNYQIVKAADTPKYRSAGESRRTWAGIEESAQARRAVKQPRKQIMRRCQREPAIARTGNRKWLCGARQQCNALTLGDYIRMGDAVLAKVPRSFIYTTKESVEALNRKAVIGYPRPHQNGRC